MLSRSRRRATNNKELGFAAEIIESDPRYRDALNAPYASEVPSIDIDTQRAYQDVADTVIIDTIKEVGVDAKPEIRHWEAGRQAIMTLLSGQALGSFENYFLGTDSIPHISAADPEELPGGEYDIIFTNNRIVQLDNVVEPLDFLDTALGVIDRQKKISHNKIGPENYSTALKLFSRKYLNLVRGEDEVVGDALVLPDLTDVKELVDEALQGFSNVASRDEPNYVEMTNIYATINALPKGAIDPRFTHDILMYTVKIMDELDSLAVGTLLSAIPKMDISEHPLETSAIVNMLLQRETQFDTTYSLRMTVRAIESLQKNDQTDAALRTFFDMAEGFEKPLDLEGIDEVLDRLKHIIKGGTEDPLLSVHAKEFADKCFAQAGYLTRKILTQGTSTQAQIEQLRETYGRIKANYQAI